MVFVTPTPDMIVRPGQHVSGEGRVYHHYLAHWGEAWDVSERYSSHHLELAPAIGDFEQN